MCVLAPPHHRTETKKAETNQAEGRGFGDARRARCEGGDNCLWKNTDELATGPLSERSKVWPSIRKDILVRKSVPNAGGTIGVLDLQP